MRLRAAEQPHRGRPLRSNPRRDLDKLKVSTAFGARQAPPYPAGFLFSPAEPRYDKETLDCSTQARGAHDEIEPGRFAGWRSTGIGRARLRPADTPSTRRPRDRASRSMPTTSAAWCTNPSGQPEAGVWVIAETQGSRRPLHQDRRHRRSGPLRRARSAAGELSGLGARLRPRRFRQDHQRAGRDAEPHREDRAERARGRAVLSGRLLVFDDEDPGQGRVRPRQDLPRERHAGSLSRHHQEQWLRRLPSDRPARDPHHPREVPRPSRTACMPTRGCAASSPARPACR